LRAAVVALLAAHEASSTRRFPKLHPRCRPRPITCRR
jgi:hypothetical protein